MNYCGLDLAGVSSYAYVTDPNGEKLWSGPIATAQPAFRQLVQKFGRGGLKIAIEAGNQTAWIYDALVQLQAQVVVVHPKKIKLIAESRRKTDKIDAKILCELLRLDALPCPVHMPRPAARALRGLLALRRQFISTRTKYANMACGLLRQQGVILPARQLTTMIGWRRLLEQGFEHDHLLRMICELHANFCETRKSIRALDAQLALHAAQDPRAARLQTMPKVGPIAALTFLAAVDDVQRFSSSRKLIGYAGLAPTVRQSGDRANYGPITREGRRELRAVWVQIAHLVAIDHTRATQSLRKWFERIVKKRGRKTALVALARRLLVIAYQLLKSNADFDPAKLKKQKPQAA